MACRRNTREPMFSVYTQEDDLRVTHLIDHVSNWILGVTIILTLKTIHGELTNSFKPFPTNFRALWVCVAILWAGLLVHYVIVFFRK